MLFNFIFTKILTSTKLYINPNVIPSSSYLFTTLTLNSSKQNTFTVNYLINSCGVSPDSAVIASKHLDLSKSLNLTHPVLDFLRNQGFSKSQVSKVISRYPRVLLCDPEKTLLPSFETLSSIGLSSSELVEIVTARPKGILNKRFQDRCLGCFDYLKSVLGSDEKVIYAIKRFPLALTYDLQVYAAENIRILEEIGVPMVNIEAMFAQQPRTFLTSADKFREVVDDVTDMGFDPSKTRFLWGIHAVRAMSKSTWDKKVELYKKWGWCEDEIYMAFEKYPGCMMASMDKITKILDFVVNTMGWEKGYIIRWSIVICFSLEKRIIPRCLVYQHLAEKGLTEEKDGFCFTKWLMYSEKKFVKWVKKRYEEEAPELLKVYKKHLDEANESNSSTLRTRVAI
ncbi:transcription termination factor like protein [Tanacetum coccineum]